jgi:hypothetical protein
MIEARESYALEPREVMVDRAASSVLSDQQRLQLDALRGRIEESILSIL